MTDHILDHKTHLNILKSRNHIICMLHEYNGTKQEIKTRKTAGKSPNNWRLDNTLLNNTWVKAETSSHINKYFKLN